jgi:hypothetical protein
MRTLFAMMLLVSVAASAQQKSIPDRYWPEAKSSAVLAKTETIRLDADLSRLTDAERAALKDLLAAGAIMQKLYEVQRHPDALPAYAELRKLYAESGGSKQTENLLQLYRFNQGPIAQTLDNKREPFLPVAAQVPGRNVYPQDVTREELDKYLAAHPEQRDELLDPRTVVRRTTKSNLDRDIQVLDTFALLRELHPTLLAKWKPMQYTADGTTFYAVPYAVAYADDLVTAFRLLTRAANTLQFSDAEFAGYLRNRARDLVTNDYESGDASWITGHFKHLNAQIGSYETYDDALYGVKAFHSFSLLLEDEKATEDVRRALGGIQAIEDALPYEHHKRVREDIPVGVYDVIADFGQARGTNTATNLPNDPLMSRRYGRIILLRENILKNPSIVAASQRIWRAAVADAHANDLGPNGDAQRTLWHEIGHYLGPDRDKQGRTIDVALEEFSDATEEMKADLVSLYALQRMNAPDLRAIEAAGIRRVLLNNQPRADQAYQFMELVQFNWFLDKGLLTADPKTARLTIHYDRYEEAVTSLLRELLALQFNGDKAAAAAFFARWTKWTPELHEKLAARVRDAQGAQFRIVKYAALGE